MVIGALDNIERLLDGQVDVALVQAGVADVGRTQGLQTLGSVFHEPLWIFVRAGLEVDLLSDLGGKRLELGPVGSGTRALALRLLAANGIADSNTERGGAPVAEAAEALERGEVDALFLVASVDSPAVRSLLDGRSRAGTNA